MVFSGRLPIIADLEARFLSCRRMNILEVGGSYPIPVIGYQRYWIGISPEKVTGIGAKRERCGIDGIEHSSDFGLSLNPGTNVRMQTGLYTLGADHLCYGDNVFDDEAEPVRIEVGAYRRPRDALRRKVLGNHDLGESQLCLLCRVLLCGFYGLRQIVGLIKT